MPATRNRDRETAPPKAVSSGSLAGSSHVEFPADADAARLLRAARGHHLRLQTHARDNLMSSSISAKTVVRADLHSTATDGLIRGAEGHRTGAPISVPVGDVTKGHVFNVARRADDVPPRR